MQVNGEFLTSIFRGVGLFGHFLVGGQCRLLGGLLMTREWTRLSHACSGGGGYETGILSMSRSRCFGRHLGDHHFCAIIEPVGHGGSPAPSVVQGTPSTSRLTTWGTWTPPSCLTAGTAFRPSIQIHFNPFDTKKQPHHEGFLRCGAFPPLALKLRLESRIAFLNLSFLIDFFAQCLRQVLTILNGATHSPL